MSQFAINLNTVQHLTKYASSPFLSNEVLGLLGRHHRIKLHFLNSRESKYSIVVVTSTRFELHDNL